jgi:hypothetical protein
VKWSATNFISDPIVGGSERRFDGTRDDGAETCRENLHKNPPLLPFQSSVHPSAFLSKSLRLAFRIAL